MTPQFPLQAATSFEQKVLHWPIGWLWEKALERRRGTKLLLMPNTARRSILTRSICLLFSAMLMYISFLLWKNLVPYIQVIVNDPIIGLEYVPPTRQHLLDIFLKWISLAISIYSIVLAIILIRLRNMSFLVRFTMFCYVGGVSGMSNWLWDFGMPAFILIGGRTFFSVLLSMASLSWLLGVFYVEAWMDDDVYPNANKVGK